MATIIQLALQILNGITEALNRESSSDEKLKEFSIKSSKDYKKAVFFARQIFDGYKKYKGLDVLLKDKLEEKDYEMYLRLRARFNKFS